MEAQEDPDALPTLHANLLGLQAVLQRAVAAPAVQAASYPAPDRAETTPRTLGECFTAAQNAATEKETKKKKQDKAAETSAPIGGDYLTGAFPNHKEAPFMAWSEEFFRPLRKEDVERAFSTHLADPIADPCFKMPALGTHYMETWAAEDAAAAEEPQRELPETRQSARTRVPATAKGSNRGGNQGRGQKSVANSSKPQPQQVRGEVHSQPVHGCISFEFAAASLRR